MAPGNTSNSSAISSAKIGASMESQSQNVIKNALKMAFGTMTSRVLGLLREMAFAAMFSRPVTDAWNAAFRIPNLFRRLLGEGSMSVSFIPVFIDARIRDEKFQAERGASGESGDPDWVHSQNLVNGFYTLLLIFLSALTILGTYFSRDILNFLLDPIYIQDVAKMEMTVRMAQIMFVFIFLISTYAYFMGILNALGYYALAAVAPTFWNISMLCFTFIPGSFFAQEGDGLAWGVVVGAALQAGVLLPSLVKLGYFPRWVRPHFSSDILRVLRNMVPGLIGTGLLQFTTVVNLRFASQLREGSISYINWADRILELPLSLIAVSLGTALLPTLADMWSRREAEKMSNTANYYLRINLFMAVPAALGLFALSGPIIELMFQRGKFTAEDAAQTALVLKVYAFLMISASCVRVLVPVYYAVKNTWYPAVVSGICLFVHILIGPTLMAKWGLVGLVSSTFTSATLNMLLLMGGVNFLVTSFDLRKILLHFIKYLPGGLVLLLFAQSYFLICSSEDFFLKKAFVLGVVMLVAFASYMGIASILGLEEYQNTVRILAGKILRKFQKKSL